MRGFLVAFSVACMLLASGAAAGPLDADSSKPLAKKVVFVPGVEAGVAQSGFHPPRGGNRVFYAASLKQARGWARFTSIPNNPGDYDFSKYSVLAVFYKGRSVADATFDSAQESAAGDLSAMVTLVCDNPLCPAPPNDPSHPWGMYVLVKIVKPSLLKPPKTLHVATAFSSP
jgi:hypothetical protein